MSLGEGNLFFISEKGEALIYRFPPLHIKKSTEGKYYLPTAIDENVTTFVESCQPKKARAFI